MSKYTTELRYICENAAGLSESKGYTDVENIISSARTKIFDFNYPIFDENYKSVLETKIIKHYYTREIGAETVGLWKFWLNTKMNEIMPYYNQMYNSELLEFNPLNDTNITTTRNTERNDNENESGSFSETGTRDITVNTDISDTTSQVNERTEGNDDWNEYSDTPQGGLTGIENHTYLTNATHDTHEGTAKDEISVENTVDNNQTTDEDTSRSGSNSKEREATNTEEYVEHVIGKRGGSSFAGMLNEFRQTFLNIDMMVIEELSDLFINLW